MNSLRHLPVVLLAGALTVGSVLTVPASADAPNTVTDSLVLVESAASAAALADTGAAVAGLSSKLISAAAEAGLALDVLTLGLRAHERVRAEGLTDRSIVTIVDYSRLSREPRLWVLDVATGEVLVRELVAHGRNTGGDEAVSFSNREGSYKSSVGTFVTGGTYVGKHGRSLRLRGLDEGLNDNAESRAIVIHGADYVSEDIVGQLGRLGRSLGCPALSPEAAREVIDLIKDGTTFFAYHPSADLEQTLPPLVS